MSFRVGELLVDPAANRIRNNEQEIRQVNNRNEMPVLSESVATNRPEFKRLRIPVLPASTPIY